MQDQSSTYRLVNWEQSMEIGLSHFRQTEDFFINRIRDTRALRLKSYNYGILPSLDGKGSSSVFDINEQVTGKVEIRLMSCNAITAGGCRINFNPSPLEYLTLTHSFGEGAKIGQTGSSAVQQWDVILSVDPYRRVPTGEPSLEESQARHPDAGEFYGLSITPQGKMNHDQLGMHHLVIGRVRLRGGRYEVDTDYIPPATSMSSHPDLINYYQRFGSRLSEIEKASKAIIAKINNRPTKSPVGEHLEKICEEIMRYIAGIFFLYRNTGREATPVEIVNYFSTLAHVCYVSLHFLENSEKEQLLNYFYEWSDVTPGTFEELLAGTLGILYDHNNIRTAMMEVDTFLYHIAELWTRLSALEFIGQRKGNVVVSERTHHQETPKQSTAWTVFD